MEMNSWYDITSLRGNVTSRDQLYHKYSREQLIESYEIVKSVIDLEVEKLGGDSSKVYVGGFSQGCALSIATMLFYPKVLGAMIGLSGMNAIKVDWS